MPSQPLQLYQGQIDRILKSDIIIDRILKSDIILCMTIDVLI